MSSHIAAIIALSFSMKRARKTPHSTSRRGGHVRIIAGQWRGRKLPVHDLEGLRPTTDRNKETLFNWLMHDTQNAVCLDVFAGAGSLGMEALSRYASQCDFFEKDAQAASQLKTNLATLQANGTVSCGDALSLLKTSHNSYDIIFIDPPFNQGLVQPALDIIVQRQLIKPNGLIYIEQEANASLPAMPDTLQIIKSKQLSGLSYLLIEAQAMD